MAEYGGDALYDSFKANADLSSYQYFCVSCGSVAGEVKLASTASNPGIIGILQDDPTSELVGQVCLFGITKAAAYGAANDGTATAIAYGDMLIAGSDGRLHYQATASSICNAIALEALGSGALGIITVLLFPGIGVHTAADNTP